MTNIILSGANGRMGRAITQKAEKSGTCKIVAGYDINDFCDNTYTVYTDIEKCETEADVIVDFSHPSAFSRVLGFAKKRKLPLIVATTGLSEEQKTELFAAQSEIPVFYSANMSLGVNLLLNLCKKTAAVLDDKFDIEIVEKHHNKKLDAPSGTALSLADGISEMLKNAPQYVYDRHSVRRERAKNEIGIMHKPVLMPPSLMELITIIEDEEIKVKMYDNYQTEIHTSEIDIIGSTMEEVVDFPLAEITSVDVPFESSCKVSRTNLLNVLDRLSLFIETYDENGIYLNFTKNKLIITSKKDNASESVAYIKSNIEVDAFVCLINIITLKKQLEAYTSDIITLEFGREEAIKLSNGKLSHQISTLGE